MPCSLAREVTGVPVISRKLNVAARQTHSKETSSLGNFHWECAQRTRGKLRLSWLLLKVCGIAVPYLLLQLLPLFDHSGSVSWFVIFANLIACERGYQKKPLFSRFQLRPPTALFVNVFLCRVDDQLGHHFILYELHVCNNNRTW